MGSGTTEYCLFWIGSWCMPRSDWAAWVQAIGSLFALAIAIGVPALQHRAQESARRGDKIADAERLLNICIGIAARANEILRSIAEHTQTHGNNAYPSGDQQQRIWIQLQALRDAPLFRLPSSFEVSVVLSMQRQLEDAFEALNGPFLGPLTIPQPGQLPPEGSRWRATYAYFNDDLERLRWAARSLRDPSEPAPGT